VLALAALVCMGPVTPALGAVPYDRSVLVNLALDPDKAPTIGIVFLIDITGDNGGDWTIGTGDVSVAVNSIPAGTFHFDAVRPPVSGSFCGGQAPCGNSCPPLDQNVAGQCGECSCRYTLAQSMPWPLQEGDRVEAWVVASQGALPELDTSDDYAVAEYRTTSVLPVWTGGFTLAVAPSPFGASTRVVFGLPFEGRTDVDIFDITGRRIRSLSRGATFGIGSHALTWDGRDERGRRRDPGIYTVVLRANGQRLLRRVVLVR
jgi:hypothetical protein